MKLAWFEARIDRAVERHPLGIEDAPTEVQREQAPEKRTSRGK